MPQGGNTGLVGGGVPLRGEVVLSLRRLDVVSSVNAVVGQITAGAGATVSAVQSAARAAGWDYGVDWGARETATIGGSIATNAGGSKVARYGDTRAQVIGVEAVLGNGSVVSHLDGLVKDNTGYHLPSLLCGSEGTLAVVTAARAPPRASVRRACGGDPRLQLRRRRAHRLRRAATGVVLARGGGAVLRRRPRAGVLELRTAEAVRRTSDGLFARRVRGSPRSVGRAASVVVELERDRCGGRRATRRGARELWRYREAHTEAINRSGAHRTSST